MGDRVMRSVQLAGSEAPHDHLVVIHAGLSLNCRIDLIFSMARHLSDNAVLILGGEPQQIKALERCSSWADRGSCRGPKSVSKMWRGCLPAMSVCYSTQRLLWRNLVTAQTL
jgi:hypothetical protein